MNELISLMEAGFTERQALAILNAAYPKKNTEWRYANEYNK